MRSFARDRAGPDIPSDWRLLLADALAFVQEAMGCTETGAKETLAKYARDARALDWDFELTVFGLLPAGALVSDDNNPDDRRTLEADIRRWFWVCHEDKGAILWRDSAATYIGPSFSSAEFRVIDKASNETRAVYKGALARRDLVIEFRLDAIRLRGEPLIAYLRARGGAVDQAIEALRRRGRLPAAAASQTKSEKAWLADELARHPPRPKQSKVGWARSAAQRSGRKANAIATLLSQYRELWTDAGGKPTSPAMRRKRKSSRGRSRP